MRATHAFLHYVIFGIFTISVCFAPFNVSFAQDGSFLKNIVSQNSVRDIWVNTENRFREVLSDRTSFSFVSEETVEPEIIQDSNLSIFDSRTTEVGQNLLATVDGMGASVWSSIRSFFSNLFFGSPEENNTQSAPEPLQEIPPPIEITPTQQTPPQRELPPEQDVKKDEPVSIPVKRDVPVTVSAPVRTVIERVIERTVEVPTTTVSGVSETSLTERLNQLENALKTEIYRVASNANTRANDNYAAIALTNRINNLSNVTISGATITSSTFDGTLSGSSGAFTGAVSGATASFTGASNFGSTLYVDSVNSRVGVGTSSPSDTLSVNGPAYFAQVSAPSVTTNRLYNTGGSLYFNGTALGGGSSGLTSLNGLTGATQTFTDDTNVTIASSGTAHALGWSGQLSVARGGTGLSSYTLGDLLYASGTGTLAGTSTANLKSSLALNNVENTALSTWAGSTNLTTLGTITSGTWNGGTISVARGGTGQTSFGQGWLHSDGSTLTASTSPTVNYIIATSTTATSTFANTLRIGTDSTNQNLLGIIAPSGKDYSASVSTGGVVNLTTTNSTGAGLVIYNNQGATASGRLLAITADNSAFDQQVAYFDQDGTSGALVVNCDLVTGSSLECATVTSVKEDYSAFGVTGNEIGKGTVKITHNGSGVDTNASALSLLLTSTSTASAAQGIFLDSSGAATTGKLLNLRNNAVEYLTLSAAGRLGLSTSTPAYTLSVEGSSTLGNEAIAGYFTATSTTATSTAMGSFFVGTTTPGRNRFAVQAKTGQNSPFAVYNSSGNTSKPLIYTGSGYGGDPFVGINTNDAGYAALAVLANGTTYQSPNATTQFLFEGNSTTDVTLTVRNNDSTVDMVIGDCHGHAGSSCAGTNSNGGVGVLGTKSNHDLRFLTNGGTRAAITVGGLMGIGTTTPYSKLSVWGSGTGTGQAFEIANNASTTIAKFNDNGTGYFLGNIGIASTTPWRTFSVNGTVALNGLTSSATGNALCITTGKDITDAGGGTCTPSSQRFKENIQALTPREALSTLGKLRVVSFDYKSEYASPEESPASVGLIAEEVEKVDPRLVDYGYDGLPLTLHFERITGLTVGAVQELNLNLETIAGTTASSTPESRSFASSFFSNIFAQITEKFASVANGIGDFFANRVHTKTLCVGDSVSGETCVTKVELDKLLSGATTPGSQNAGVVASVMPIATTTAPVEIIVSGNNPQTVNLKTAWGDLGATASSTDLVLVNLGVRAFQNGAEVTTPIIDTSVTGTHEIVYKVINGAGAMLAEAMRIVNVVDPNPIVVPIATTTPAITATSTQDVGEDILTN